MHIKFPKHSVQIIVKAACALARVCCDRRLIENEIQWSMPDVARWGTASGPARLSTTIRSRITSKTCEWGIIKHRKDHTWGLGDHVTIAARSLDKAEKTRSRVAKYKVKVAIGCQVVTIWLQGGSTGNMLEE